MRGVPENLAVPGSRDALYESASPGWNRVESRDAGLSILGARWTNRHREMGLSQTCLITLAVLTGPVVTPGSRSARFVVAFLISTLLPSWQQTRLRKLSVRSKGISNDSLVSRCRLQARCLSSSSLRGEASRSKARFHGSSGLPHRKRKMPSCWLPAHLGA